MDSSGEPSNYFNSWNTTMIFPTDSSMFSNFDSNFCRNREAYNSVPDLTNNSNDEVSFQDENSLNSFIHALTHFIPQINYPIVPKDIADESIKIPNVVQMNLTNDSMACGRILQNTHPMNHADLFHPLPDNQRFSAANRQLFDGLPDLSDTPTTTENLCFDFNASSMDPIWNSNMNANNFIFPTGQQTLLASPTIPGNNSEYMFEASDISPISTFSRKNHPISINLTMASSSNAMDFPNDRSSYDNVPATPIEMITVPSSPIGYSNCFSSTTSSTRSAQDLPTLENVEHWNECDEDPNSYTMNPVENISNESTISTAVSTGTSSYSQELVDSIPPVLIPICQVCGKRANGCNYGVMSCDACKMFFRRNHVEKLKYICKNENRCLSILECKACRFGKCKSVGMLYMNRSIRDSDDGNIGGVLEFLQTITAKHEYRENRLKSFYSRSNPSLDDILRNKGAMKKFNKEPDYNVKPEEWAFLSLYSHILFFLSFDFVDHLSYSDKKEIFMDKILKLTYFGGLMRTIKEKRPRMLNPGGKEEIYPENMIQHFSHMRYDILSVTSEPIQTMNELEISENEYLLLSLIIFCEPAGPNVSEEIKKILQLKKTEFGKSLQVYCQHYYQQDWPDRFNKLINLCYSVTKKSEQLENLFLKFHMHSNFEFKKLVKEVFHMKL